MTNKQIWNQQIIKRWIWVLLSIMFVTLAQILLKFSMLTNASLTSVATVINYVSMLFDSLFSPLIHLANSFTVIEDSNWIPEFNLESIEIEYTLVKAQIDTLTITTMLFLLLGLITYGASFYCWQRVLYFFPLSQAYSLLAISYITVFYAVKLLALYYPNFHEPSSIHHHVAVFLIFIGVCMTQRKISS